MIVQTAIVLFSGFSIWALSGKHYRLGFITGLCGQPFWFYASLSDGQWGVFLVSVWFTLNHLRGLWTHRNIAEIPIMKTGTKSVLFGVHQFIIHPFTVYLAWIWLYKSLPTWKETVCILIHDWGYWGKAKMDDEEGEKHPELAARIASALFDTKTVSFDGTRAKFDEPDRTYHRDLCLYHSRHYARKAGVEPSRLCWADKASHLIERWWTYLPRAILSGELAEYRKEAADTGFIPESRTNREWFDWLQKRFTTVVKEKKGDVVTYINPGRATEARG